MTSTAQRLAKFLGGQFVEGHHSFDEGDCRFTLLQQERGIHQRAVALFKESAAKLPDNLAVQYHLGLVYLKAGEKENARSVLAAAVRYPGTFLASRRRERRWPGSISEMFPPMLEQVWPPSSGRIGVPDRCPCLP